MAYILQDYFNAGDNAANNFYGNVWGCQTLTAGSSYPITQVGVKLYRAGTGAFGTITIGIRATSAGKPTVADLVSATMAASGVTTNTAGAWYYFALADTALTSGTVYSIVVRHDSSGVCYWLSKSTAGYSGGSHGYSTNGGSTWTMNTSYDDMFETYSTTTVVDLAGSSTETFVTAGGLSTPKSLTGVATVSFISVGNVVKAAILIGAASFSVVTVGYLNTGDFLNVHARRRMIVAGSDSIWIQD